MVLKSGFKTSAIAMTSHVNNRRGKKIQLYEHKGKGAKKDRTVKSSAVKFGSSEQLGTIHRAIKRQYTFLI
jgi:hypothetical protein